MYSIYKIEQGDNWNSISNKFNVSLDLLQRTNGMVNSDMLYPGSYIIIPMNAQDNSNEKYSTYIVKNGDNVYSIAQNFGIPYEMILKINGLNETDFIYPNQQLLIPNKMSNIYITNGNETIQSLYEKYKNNWEKFLQNNQLIYVVADQVIEDN